MAETGNIFSIQRFSRAGDPHQHLLSGLPAALRVVPQPGELAGCRAGAAVSEGGVRRLYGVREGLSKRRPPL